MPELRVQFPVFYLAITSGILSSSQDFARSEIWAPLQKDQIILSSRVSQRDYLPVLSAMKNNSLSYFPGYLTMTLIGSLHNDFNKFRICFQSY